jgi:hypothetical protein
MFHGRGVSFALSEAETIWSSILKDAIGWRAFSGLWRGASVATAARRTGVAAAFACRIAPLRCSDAGSLSGSRMSLHVQLLLGDQNCRTRHTLAGY